MIWGFVLLYVYVSLLVVSIANEPIHTDSAMHFNPFFTRHRFEANTTARHKVYFDFVDPLASEEWVKNTLLSDYYHRIKRKCNTPEESSQLSDLFLQATSFGRRTRRWQYLKRNARWARDGSNCPEEDLMLNEIADFDLLAHMLLLANQTSAQHLQKAGPFAPDDPLANEDFSVLKLRSNPFKKYFVNIGFNKAYNYVKWLQLFAQWTQVDGLFWVDSLLKTNVMGNDRIKACGECDDCNDNPIRNNTIYDKVIKRLYRKVLRGHSGDSLESIQSPSLSSHNYNDLGTTVMSHVNILGIDLNRQNIRIVEKALDRIWHHQDGKTFNVMDPNLDGVHLYNMVAALSDKNEKREFSDCPPAIEDCDLGETSFGQTESKKSNSSHVINIYNLDSILDTFEMRYHKHHRANNKKTLLWTHARLQDLVQAAQNISTRKFNRYYRPRSEQYDNELRWSSNHHMVDYLLIDTEGHESVVLQGALQTLRMKKVKMIVFEYHRVGMWAYTRVGAVVDQLDTEGYDCYWMGVNRLWPITGCYTAKMEFHNWANVACFLRGHAYHNVAQKYVVDLDRLHDDGYI
jgi:hypothetical protein